MISIQTKILVEIYKLLSIAFLFPVLIFGLMAGENIFSDLNRLIFGLIAVLSLSLSFGSFIAFSNKLQSILSGNI